MWEALALASHLRLSNLVLIVDANGLQGLGATGDVLSMEPLGAKLAAFGWEVADVDGHDHWALGTALRSRAAGPTAVIARTTKGYGWTGMEGDVMSHYRPIKPADRDRVLAELGGCGS